MAQRPYPGAPRFQPFAPPSVSRMPTPQIGRVSAPSLSFMKLSEGDDILTKAIQAALSEFVGEAVGEGLETAVDWGVDSLGGYKEKQPAPNSEYQPDTRRTFLAQGSLGEAARRHDPHVEQQAGIGVPEVQQGFEQEVARQTQDKQSAAQYIVQRAQKIGLDPRIALSMWQQESGGSLDTKLKGPDLSRNRGNAIGPFQVVPHYHPDFPVNGTFQQQADYALDYLKEVGPARYYGTGQAPAGHPTTAQYVQQVQNRAAGIQLPEQAPSSGGRGVTSPGETQVAQRSPLPPSTASPSPGGGAPNVLPEREYGALGQLFGTQKRYDAKREKSQRNALAELGIKRGQLSYAQELEAWADEQKYLDSLTPAERDDVRAAKYHDPTAIARRKDREERERMRLGGRPEIITGPNGERLTWNPQTRQMEPIPGMPAPEEPAGPAAPSGYRWTPEQGLEPIPGGPADKPAEVPKPPSGYQWVDPSNPDAGVAPIAGTAEDVKRQDQFQSIQAGLQAIDALRQNVMEHGEGFIGTSKANRITQRNLAAELVTVLSGLGNAGVLQQGEVEYYQSLVPDPSKFSPFTGEAAIHAALNAIEDRLRRRYGLSPRQGTEDLSQDEQAELDGYRQSQGAF